MWPLFRRPALVLILGVYFYIFYFLLSYDHAWMHIEEGMIKQGILAHGRNFSAADWRPGLDYNLFEYAPRFTRLLSWYFELVDTKLRVFLWDYIFPHPSMSLTWVFSFIFSPWLLYKFLRKWSVDVNTALCAVSLYLVNPGFLSTVVMLFRPSKAMTNFAILLCLYVGSVVFSGDQKINKAASGARHPLRWEFWAFIGLMCFSFLWDETALLIYPAVFLFFYNSWKNKWRLIVFLCLPVFVAVLYFKLIPSLVCWAGYPVKENLGDWTFSFYNGSLIFRVSQFWEYFTSLYSNFAGLLFRESFGLVAVHPSAPVVAKILVNLSGIALSILVVTVFINLRRDHRQKKLSSDFYREMSVWTVGLLALASVHVILMCLFRQVVWGLFWYGTYWPVFFMIFLARVFYYARINQYVLTLIVGIIVVNCSFVFPSLNTSVKNFQYYHKFNARELTHTGVLSRFDPAYGPVYDAGQLRRAVNEFRGLNLVQRQRALTDLSQYPSEIRGLLIEMAQKN